MKPIKVFIWLNAILFVLYGLAFMFAPQYLSMLITDAVPASSSALIDMRATYGGISLGFGLLLAYATRKVQTLEFGTWGIILVVGGMAIGRLLGIILDGSPNTTMYVYLALEIIVVVLAFVLLPNLKTSLKESK